MAKKIFVAGHNGMVGSAIVKKLSNDNDIEIVVKGKHELNLISQKEVQNFFLDSSVDEVYLAAAKVGGIHANSSYPGEFIYENIMIQANIIHAALTSGVKKLLFLGSSCIYPRMAAQPIHEEYLLSGALEPTNEPYAIAKIAGIKMCESYNRQYGVDYRCIMPTNLYGPKDNFHAKNSHVIPGLIRRFHDAKIRDLSCVNVWGTGNPRREFLYVDDMADASIFLMNINRDIFYSHNNLMCSHINVGSGIDYSIKELSVKIKDVVGFNGEIKFDSSKPDGTPRKLLDVSILKKLGWSPSIDLSYGLKKSYEWYIKNSFNETEI